MEIAKIDLEVRKLKETIKNNRKLFLENYKEIMGDTNKYMTELKVEYTKEIKRLKDNLDDKIKGLMDILKHLEEITDKELSKTDKNEVKYDLRIVLSELEKFKKEKELYKNII